MAAALPTVNCEVLNRWIDALCKPHGKHRAVLGIRSHPHPHPRLLPAAAKHWPHSLDPARGCEHFPPGAERLHRRTVEAACHT